MQSSNFGLLQSVALDGQVYAQPLYLNGVVFVATQHNTVYAFNEATLAVLWSKSLMGPPNTLPGITAYRTVPPEETGSNDITVEIGVTATPVIDAASGTIYIEAKTRETVGSDVHYVHRLHALDVATGNPKFGSPKLIADTVLGGAFTYVSGPSVRGTGAGSQGGFVTFNALRELCRPGLALSAGTVYVTCASHGDIGDYHGWILGYDAATLALEVVFNTSPNGSGAGIWQSGVAPSFDADGNMFLATGNGTFDALNASNFPANANYGNSVMKLAPDSTSTEQNPNPNGWGLRVVDYFTPYDQETLNFGDQDMGSGGILLLPDGAGPSSSPSILITAGKAGELFVINRNNMGKYNSAATVNRVVQDLVRALPGGGGMFTSPALIGNQVFLAGRSLGRYTMNAGAIAGVPDGSQTVAGFNFPGPSPTISAQGSNEGIVWVLSRSSNQLLAFSTDNLGQLLFQGLTPSRVVKFSVPTVANGRVFVASGDETQSFLTSWGIRSGGSGQSQTITFDPLPATTTYGVAPITMRATASSGLGVTLSIVSGPASVNGSQLTILGAGTVIVQASQSGNSTWAPATSITQTVQVAKAGQTITFAALGNRTTSSGVLPLTATGGLSTSPVAFQVISGSASITGSSLTATGIGAVTVRASQAGDANYNAATSIDRTFQVALGASALLTPTAGTPQSTGLSSAYPVALAARVTDGGVPLAGVPVQFSAPVAAVSGTFAGGAASATSATNGSGIATSPIYSANGNAGTSSVTATISTGSSTNFVLTQGGTLVPNPGQYSGVFDYAGCDGAKGWALDLNRLNQSISVDLMEGSTVLATALANGSRADVGALVGDNGLHGFDIAIPDSIKNGATHILTVRFTGSTTNLSSSPRSIQCGSAPSQPARNLGYFDYAGCDGAKGWAVDLNRLNQSISVDLLEGSTVLATVLANGSRLDVGAFVGDNGLHGFDIPIPNALKNGTPHTLSMRFTGSSELLSDSPRTIQCGTVPTQPVRNVGFFDYAGCDAARGWAVDLNRLNQTISVDLMEGSTVLATVLANGSRPDVGAFIGDNGFHGFDIPIPESLKNGTSRTLTMRFTGSTDVLNNSPRSIQCGTVPVQPARSFGFFDYAGCDGAKGWAVDLNRLNQPVSVDLLEGSTVLATVLANGSRPDVGAFVGDNGLHGFDISIPDSLKNGTLRSLTMRISGNADPLTNSPRTIQCNSSTPQVIGPIAPIGHLDYAGCDTISGWAADLARPNQPFYVEILDGSTVVATVQANAVRSDLRTYLGDNGAHAFSVPTPAALKTGAQRSVQARFLGTIQYLSDSPRTLQCSVP